MSIPLHLNGRLAGFKVRLDSLGNVPDAGWIDCGMVRLPCARKLDMANKLAQDRAGSEPLSTTHFEVTLPADVAAISPVIGWVMRLIDELDYSAGKEFEIEMALREALANAILHGCKSDPAKTIQCLVTGDRASGIQIIVRDPGQGFDPKSLPSPADGFNLFSDHGRGIFLINELMDEVKHENNGSEIRMRKY